MSSLYHLLYVNVMTVRQSKNRPIFLTRMTAEDSFNSDIRTVVVERPELVVK